MHRFLERLDGGAATIVPLLYLAGLALGAASYFAGVTLAGENAGLVVGVALATAAELHSFLQQRRVRAVWAQLQRTPDDATHASERDALELQLKVYAWILVALLAFSAFNATAFVAATWRPAPGWLPGWLQIGIRGLVIPVFFFLSGYLVPIHTDASEQLRATSTDMLRRTLRAIGKQWRQRLAEAQRRHADLAPIAIALLEDVGDSDGARRVQLIAAGLEATTAPEGAGVAVTPPSAQMTIASIEASQRLPTAAPGANLRVSEQGADTSVVASSASRTPDDDPPPDGNRSPTVVSKQKKMTAANVTPISRSGMGRSPRRDRRAVNRNNALSGRRGSAEQRVRATIAAQPSLGDVEVARLANVSSSTVSKWRAVVEAEQQRAAAQAQEA